MLINEFIMHNEDMGGKGTRQQANLMNNKNKHCYKFFFFLYLADDPLNHIGW